MPPDVTMPADPDATPKLAPTREGDPKAALAVELFVEPAGTWQPSHQAQYVVSSTPMRNGTGSVTSGATLATGANLTRRSPG